MTQGTLPYFGKNDQKYYEKDMRRRISIASEAVNSTAVYVKCKIAWNCKRRDLKSACLMCILNKGNSTVPMVQRQNHFKPVIDTGKPLSIDGRIREKIDQPIFL